MSPRTRLLIVAAASAAVAAAAAPAAQAAPVLSNNACTGGDGTWGTLPLQLEASGTQNGRNLEVGGIAPSVTIPNWLEAKLSAKGFEIWSATGTSAGNKTFNVDAWMAVTGENSTDAPKVLKTTGALTFKLNDLGGFKFSVTNVALSLQPSAATSWHAADAGGSLDIAQGAAGTLPQIPGGQGGANVTPKGSLWIRGTVVGGLANGYSLTIDCQPGTSSDPQNLTSIYTPGKAPAILSSAFAAVAGPLATPAPGTAATPTPAPVATPEPATGATQAAGALAIASPSLKFGSAAVLVNVTCPAGADCTGSATITSAKKLKVGKGSAKVRKLAAGSYTVKAGTTGPIKLKLSADGKKLKKKALIATVTLKPTAGSAVAKNLRAN
ncbi:MAG: hypothetical protein PGN13_10780 [Patulibacter minatonensis]